MNVLGKGRAEAIRDRDFALLADEIGCHPADLEAIALVESNGFGWFKDGRIKILFEKHWMHRLTEGAARRAAVKAGVARAKWISPAAGGYKDQSNADARYRMLKKAITIDGDAAYQSISMGRFQIMGFNHGICGFISAKRMFLMFCDSEVHQLRAFARFLKEKGLYPALRQRDFETIEDIYNGGGLNGAYARKMRRESDKLRQGKWAGYTPGAPKPAPIPPLKPEPDHAPEPVAVGDPARPAPEPRPGTGGAKPVGIAAALIVAAGALWAKWEAFTTWIGSFF